MVLIMRVVFHCILLPRIYILYCTFLDFISLNIVLHILTLCDLAVTLPLKNKAFLLITYLLSILFSNFCHLMFSLLPGKYFSLIAE